MSLLLFLILLRLRCLEWWLAWSCCSLYHILWYDQDILLESWWSRSCSFLPIARVAASVAERLDWVLRLVRICRLQKIDRCSVNLLSSFACLLGWLSILLLRTRNLWRVNPIDFLTGAFPSYWWERLVIDQNLLFIWSMVCRVKHFWWNIYYSQVSTSVVCHPS